jgi:hypothetical protein
MNLNISVDRFCLAEVQSMVGTNQEKALLMSLEAYQLGIQRKRQGQTMFWEELTTKQKQLYWSEPSSRPVSSVSVPVCLTETQFRQMEKARRLNYRRNVNSVFQTGLHLFLRGVTLARTSRLVAERPTLVLFGVTFSTETFEVSSELFKAVALSRAS